MERKIILDGPVRIVDHYTDGFWERYVIEPRATVVERVRAARRRGAALHEIKIQGLINPQWVSVPHYDGPGGPFARRASVRVGRRFVVTRQSGGLDI